MIAVIHGSQGAGKTTFGEMLRQHYRCTRVVDDWDGKQPLADGDLVLTDMSPPFESIEGMEEAIVESFSAAMMHLAVSGPKFIQIACTNDDVFALDEHGRVWGYSKANELWVGIPRFRLATRG
jgi:hypothetical protein